MQFSDSTAKLGIIQACERYCNKGDAGISGDSTLLKEFTAHVNQWNRKVWHMIFTSYGGWQYDDSNQTNLPSSTTALVADQTSYALPSESLAIRGIEVKNANAIWAPLLPITEEKVRDIEAMGEFYKTSGQPLYYQVVGQSVRLFPPANYSQAASFKVFFDRGSVAFASTDTTKEPGFASEYHDILPIGASIEYLKVKYPESGTLALLRADAAEYEKKIKDFYTQRFEQMFPPRMTTRDQIRDYV